MNQRKRIKILRWNRHKIKTINNYVIKVNEEDDDIKFDN